MANLWIAHEFYLNSKTGIKRYLSRPRVFYGEYAKEEIDKWIEEYSILNQFTETEPEKFMNRLFVSQVKFDWQKTNKSYFEIYSIESEHFNHDCTKDKK